MYKAHRGDKTFEIDIQSSSCLIDGKRENIEFLKTGQDELEIVWKGEKHIARLHSFDRESKIIVLFLNNKRHELKIEEPVDLMLKKLGMSALSQKKVKNLKAPMPGLILKVLVEEGQKVAEGTPLLILEAMKMENIYKASAAVEVSKILVKETQAVEKNQELIQFATT